MTTTKRWTIAEVEALPDDGTKYELIDGELYEMKAAHPNHQRVCNEVGAVLSHWNRQTLMGSALATPGLVFTDEDGVIPDVVWLSNERADRIEYEDKVRGAPELVVEVLSPGNANSKRDRETKRALYDRRGADEYWIMDWQMRTVEVFRRDAAGMLAFVDTLTEKDTLQTPTLSGFAVPVKDFFITVRKNPIAKA